MPKSGENFNFMLVGLNMAYHEACDRKDYQTCDKLRMEIQRLMTGRKLLITIEDGLNLSSDVLSFLS